MEKQSTSNTETIETKKMEPADSNMAELTNSVSASFDKLQNQSTEANDEAGITTQGIVGITSAEPIPVFKLEPTEMEIHLAEDFTQKPSDFPTVPRVAVKTERPISYQAQVVQEQALESRAVLQIANSSLSLLSQYISSDSDSNITDSDEEPPRKSPAVHMPRKTTVSPSSSSSSGDDDVAVVPPSNRSVYRGQEVPIEISDEETSSDENDDEPDYDVSSEEDAPEVPPPIKAPGEILSHELPPIEELQISVPATQCKQIGQVQSIVAQIVIVQSYAGVELLNLETVLFLEQGKRPLGKIFDVIGQVQAPMYCVLFNTRQEIIGKGISVGAPVYCAPQTEHTSFIILSDLVKAKGSDASWKNDGECPDHALDYSDDEQERAARRQRRGRTLSQSDPMNHHQQQQHPYPMQRHHRGRGRGGYRGRYNNDHSWHHRITQAMQIPPPQQRVINPYAVAAAASQPPPPPPPPPAGN